MSKIAIIGSGIGGLYAAYRLKDNKDVKKIDIFEKSDQVGGRIKTVAFSGSIVEAGAGRIRDCDKLIGKLLDELDIKTSNMPPLTNQYYKDGVKTMSRLHEILQDVQDVRKDANMTFESWLRDRYDGSIVDDLIYECGYDFMFTTANGIDGFETLSRILTSSYKMIPGGMSTIVQKLLIRLVTPKVKIHLSTEITDIPLLLKKYDHVVISVTSQDLSKFGISTNAVGHPLARVYAKFEDGAFFKDIGHSTCNNPIRQFIPIDVEKGIAMISYCTDRWAKPWETQNHGRHRKLVRKMMAKRLSAAFGMNIPEPIEMETFYWPVGAHAWSPGEKGFLHAFDHERVHVCGEVASLKNHGWIEGALETVSRTLTKLSL